MMITHLLDLGVERVEIDEEIDSIVRECLHAVFVVAVGINMVDLRSS